MATQPILRMSVEEYLEYERNALEKHEFYRGEVFPWGQVSSMAGGTDCHAEISSNLIGEMFVALRGKVCRIYKSDMRLRTNPDGLYSYADLAIACGERQVLGRDTLLNPCLIGEVLSASTASYDRGAKFEEYRKIPSFREYLVVAQDRPYVEHHVREALNPAVWRMQVHQNLNDTIFLESLDVTIALSGIYRNVQFEA